MQEENLVARSLCTRSHASIALSPVAIWGEGLGFELNKQCHSMSQTTIPVLLCRGGLGRRG